MQTHLSHPKYRPDIDGLRAIAVLSVVAFHAFPNWIKGGFIGVDVFFVISGYLISTIIFENLSKGTFSFYEFYARRVKRIFPALLLVMITSYIFGWFILLGYEYRQLGKHIVGGATFVSNFMLWQESGYFDTNSEAKPLLHLWSLGVEEQFYVIYPLLLWLSYKKKFNLLSVTAIVAIVSFYLNINGIKEEPVATFFLPQTRFWELMCGSLLAWATLYKSEYLTKFSANINKLLCVIIYREPREFEDKTLINLASFFGIFLLFCGFWSIDKEANFPGWWALMPVFASVLIIYAGQEAWINKNILSNRVVVWFGLISFPLYLWHWVLLSFVRIVRGEPANIITGIVAIAISIMFSWLTYNHIEKKIRYGGFEKRKIIALISLMIALLIVGSITKNNRGLPFREVAKSNYELSNDGGDRGLMIPGCGIKDENTSKLFEHCLKDKRGNIRFALMGDSKAASLYRGLVRTSIEDGRWLFVGGNNKNGAPAPMLYMDSSLNKKINVAAIEAIEQNNEIEKVVLVSAIRMIFSINSYSQDRNFTSYNYKYLKDLNSTKKYEEVFDAINIVINRFIKAGKKVVLVIDNPALPSPEDCVIRKISFDFINRFSKNENLDCFVPLNVFNDQIKIYRKLFDELKAKHPSDVDLFDPTDIYCDTSIGICGPRRNGRVMYHHTDHISDYAASLVGEKLNSFLKK